MTCYVISTVYNLIDHSSRPISGQDSLSYCKINYTLWLYAQKLEVVSKKCPPVRKFSRISAKSLFLII